MMPVHSCVAFILWLDAMWRSRRKWEVSGELEIINCEGEGNIRNFHFLFWSKSERFASSGHVWTHLLSYISHLTYFVNDQKVWEISIWDLLLKCLPEVLETLLLGPTLISVKYGLILFHVTKTFMFKENIDVFSFRIPFSSVCGFDSIVSDKYTHTCRHTHIYMCIIHSANMRVWTVCLVHLVDRHPKPAHYF